MGQNKRKKASSSGTSPTSTSNKKSRKKQSTSKTSKANTEKKECTNEKKNVEKSKEIPKEMPIVILDSGGWTVKHGTIHPKSKDEEKKTNYIETPNCTGKLRHQIGILIGDEIHTVKNKAQLQINHPLERGYCTDFATQLEIWKRVLQREYERQLENLGNRFESYLPQCAFLLTQPFTPTTLSDHIDELLFLDLGFQRVSKRLIQCMSAFQYLESQKKSSCCLVIDSGFSLTHIVPTMNAKAIEHAIRRMNVGGKMLTNIYKENISYRQWNMMDEFFILNEVKEKASFISNQFDYDLGKHAREKRPGSRYYDKEFVLPNFVDTFTGSFRLPIGLQKEQDKRDEEELKETMKKLYKDGRKNQISKNEKQEQNLKKEVSTKTKKDDTQNDNDDDDDDDDDDMDDSDQETDEERMKRIYQKKLEEKLRREKEEQEHQVLSLSVEQFTIPEVLFHPSDIGLDQLGIVDAIVQSINACDQTLRAAMYENILLTGGNVKIIGFKERLEKELRACAPGNYKINITLPEDPIGYAWKGAQNFAMKEDFLTHHSVDKIEWEENVRIKKGNNSYLWNEMS